MVRSLSLWCGQGRLATRALPSCTRGTATTPTTGGSLPKPHATAACTAAAAAVAAARSACCIAGHNRTLPHKLKTSVLLCCTCLDCPPGCRDLLCGALGQEPAEGLLAAAAEVAEAVEARHLAAMLVRSAIAAAIVNAEREAARAAAAAAPPVWHYQAPPSGPAQPAAATTAAEAAAAGRQELPGGALPPWLMGNREPPAGLKLQANPGIAKLQPRPQPAAAGEAPAAGVPADEQQEAEAAGGDGAADAAADVAAAEAPAEPEVDAEEQRKAERRRFAPLPLQQLLLPPPPPGQPEMHLNWRVRGLVCWPA